MEEKRTMLKPLILFMLVSSFTLEMVAADETYCEAQLRIIMNDCAMLVSREPPSDECCLRIRTMPKRCVCPLVTPEIAADISADTFNYGLGIIRRCGRPVASGTKCGSFTVP